MFNKLLIILLLATVWLTGCSKTAQQIPENDKNNKTTAESIDVSDETKSISTMKFLVKTDFEYHFTKNGFYYDVIMPKVADNVINGNLINEELSHYNTLEELEERVGGSYSEDNVNTTPQSSYKRYYTTSDKDGVCSLNIIGKSLKDNGDASNPGDYVISSVYSYYYDENQDKVLTQDEYLNALGYNKQDILDSFNKKYGEIYKNRTYDFDFLTFWFDENNKLNFLSDKIDNMYWNTVDFDPIINGTTYPLGGRSSDWSPCPFGSAIDSKENYYEQVWAGSWWLEEHYSGAFVRYELNKDTGEKYPYHVEITKPNEDGFQVFTYQNATVGDSKEKILSLYPELEPVEDQKVYEMYGDYLTLGFYFENDILTKIVFDVYID